jgi:four helix bundle suffix protein
MADKSGEKRVLLSHGQYRELVSYRKSEMIYDLTFQFCERFLKRGDRTVDQMIQAARSGKQNIAEGSQAAGVSKETEIKLTSVARSSLEELLTDFEDFLRVRGLTRWPKNSREARFVRKLSQTPGVTYDAFRDFVESRSPEVVANIALCLIHQANFLLDQQLRRLDEEFLKSGGLRERMSRVRREARG